MLHFCNAGIRLGNFFQSLNEIFGDVECTTNLQLLEVAGLRLESTVSVLQQLVSLVPGESESGNVLMTLLRNFHLLSIDWRNASLFSDSCVFTAAFPLFCNENYALVHVHLPSLLLMTTGCASCYLWLLR